MRLRLNRSLKTKTKNKNEHGESRKTTRETINKNKQELNATELIIQIAFTMSIIMANFISFYTLHVAALIILFKGLTNFPKERNNEEPRVHMLSKNRNLMRLLRNWGGRKKKKKARVEIHKMHDKTNSRRDGSHKPYGHHSKTQQPG